jgi:hypothetical protein
MEISLRELLGSALSCGILAVGIMCSGNAKADILSYDQTLASPDTNAANLTDNLSWYNGSGNAGVQGDWTVDSTNGIEVGLRAKYRQGSTIDAPAGDYVVEPGNQNASHALWNYEFSIDLEPNGVGTLTIADIQDTTLTVTDVTTGATSTVFLSALATDDSGFGTTNGTTAADSFTENTANLGPFLAGWGAQNSENPEFSNFPLAATFDPNAADTYDFVLTVINNSGTVLATDSMTVTVAPEPSAVVLFGSLAFLAFRFGRRRRMA